MRRRNRKRKVSCAVGAVQKQAQEGAKVHLHTFLHGNDNLTSVPSVSLPSATILKGLVALFMGKIKDLTGQNFGRLTALRQAGMNQHHEMTWECRCSCGNIAIVSGAALRKGSTKSCGCLHREAMQNKRQKNIFYYKNDVAIVTIDGADGKMLCDKEDWERNKHLYWRLYNSGYAGTSNRVIGGRCINTFFHHEVLECPEGMYRDHINRNRLDNRSCNLRVVSPYESVLNRGMNKNNTSGVKGVTYNEKKNRWIAQICKDGKGHGLGYFKNIEDARAARIAGEVKYFGKVVS